MYNPMEQKTDVQEMKLILNLTHMTLLLAFKKKTLKLLNFWRINSLRNNSNNNNSKNFNNNLNNNTPKFPKLYSNKVIFHLKDSIQSYQE